MPRNTGCRRQLLYRNGRTRAVCTAEGHNFQTPWLPNLEALERYAVHAKERGPALKGANARG